MSIPPLIDWIVESFDRQPILTAVGVLLGLAVLFYLLRKASKLFMILLLLLVIAIGVSYFVEGPKKTEKRIKNATERVKEEVGDAIGSGGQDEPAGDGE